MIHLGTKISNGFSEILWNLWYQFHELTALKNYKQNLETFWETQKNPEGPKVELKLET